MTPYRTFKFLLAVALLAMGYVFLIGLISAILGFVWQPPSWLPQAQPWHRVAVIGWLSLLNLATSLAAALPIAAIIVWRTNPLRFAAAFTAAAAAGLYILLSVLISYEQSTRHPNAALWFDEIFQSLAVAAAVPFWIWIETMLPRRYRWRAHARPLY